MKKQEFDKFFEYIILEMQKTRDDGQKEYAHTEDNVFANFDRVGNSLNISNKKALMVYLLKHIDGINAWINGHRSQREDITGRVKDAMIYLSLLWAMIVENDATHSMNYKKAIEVMERESNWKKSTFDPDTGEVSYQTMGDQVI
jgi:hypothetical protein